MRKSDSRNGRNRKTPRPKEQMGRPAFWKRLFQFLFLVEHLPYGASLLKEKESAKALLKAGSTLMAFGGAIFAIGWWGHWNGMLQTAFVITLIGWMMVIIGFAFWTVSHAAKWMNWKSDAP